MSGTTPETDPLQELERLLPNLGAARQKKQLGASLDHAVAAVERALPGIGVVELLAPSAELIRSRLDSDGRLQIGRFLQQLDIQARLASEASTAELLSELPEKWHRVKQNADQLQTEFGRAFKVLQKAEFDHIVLLGPVLRKIPETAQVGERLEQLGQRALRFALPQDSRTRAEWDALIRERENLRGLLLGLGISDDVQLFLDYVAEGKATLADLTPQVFDWLREKNAATAFQVRL